jgi:DNA-binding CsgD family transcriptional regulator
MKYIDALKKYNEGKDKWCAPRKGSVDYLEIRTMMALDKPAKPVVKPVKPVVKPVAPARSKVKLELLNVSGRNNNCFFNSIYQIVKEIEAGKWKNGSELRKYLCNLFLQKDTIKKTIRRFKTYLEIVKLYVKEHMRKQEIADLLSVNVEEIRSLRKAKVKKVDLTNQEEIEALLEKHFKVAGRMPSGPEMSLSIDYIEKKYSVVVLPIILNHTTMDINLRNEMLDKVRRRISEKLENKIKTTGSSRLDHSAKKYRYGIIITDNTHYQLLKINNRILNTYAELSDFLESQESAFSFSRTNARSSS